MSQNNYQYDTSSGLGAGIFGITMLICIGMSMIYLPPYLMNNPPICEQEAKIKKIIAIESGDAKVQLENGKIIKHPTRNYNIKEQKFEYKINTSEPICISYKNPIDYYLHYFFVR